MNVWRCPFCSYQGNCIAATRVSTAGWVTFVVLLIFCFPLFWIGLVIRDTYTKVRSLEGLSRRPVAHLDDPALTEPGAPRSLGDTCRPRTTRTTSGTYGWCAHGRHP